MEINEQKKKIIDKWQNHYKFLFYDLALLDKPVEDIYFFELHVIKSFVKMHLWRLCSNTPEMETIPSMFQCDGYLNSCAKWVYDHKDEIECLKSN